MKIKGVFKCLTSYLTSLRLVVFIIFSLAVLLIIETMTSFIIPMISEGSYRIKYLLNLFVNNNSILLGFIASVLCFFIVAYILRISTKSKFTLRRAGIILLHLGIPVMLAGYLAGRFGVDAEIQIPKGQSSNVIHSKDGRTEKLGFSIRCEGFDVSYNKDGSPAEFISYLSFIKNGEVKKKSILRVNHPVSFEGITLYQSGYACEEAATIKIAGSSKITRIEARQGDEINPVKGVTVRTGPIIPNLMNAGPAVELFIETPDGSYNMWLLKDLGKIIQRKPDFLENHYEFNPALIKPYIFVLEGIKSSCTTGLSVRKDPGLILAAIGGIMFAIGIIIIFIPRPKPKKQGVKNGC
jgi:cytochrome c biogenesis protein